MSKTRTFASLAAAGALLLTSVAPLSSAAYAGGWKHGVGHGQHGWSQHYPRHGNRTVYVYEKKKRSHAGTAVAVGIGALILGLALSDAAHRHHGHYAPY
ncbi:MAG: hypothetical protein AB1749_03870 [Pseudomonadota bacterium]